MHTIYIDVPNSFNYDWTKGKHVNAVLENMFNVPKVEFITNSYGKITTGDCYRVTLKTEEDTLFFLIKSGFTVVDERKISKYITKMNS